jgi:hypothetical protein
MPTWNKIDESNPLSEFNDYLHIISSNKKGQVFIFKFPNDTGARVNVVDPFGKPTYRIYGLAFDDYCFAYKSKTFIETESYSECSRVISELLALDILS